MVDPFQRKIRKEFLLAGCFMAFNTINKWRRAVVEVTRRAAINNSPILPSNAKIYGGGMIYLPNILLPLAQEPSSSVLCLFPPHLSDILLNHATGGRGFVCDFIDASYYVRLPSLWNIVNVFLLRTSCLDNLDYLSGDSAWNVRLLPSWKYEVCWTFTSVYDRT